MIRVEPVLQFLKEQESILHPNNFIMTEIKLKLMEWYSEAIHKIFILGKQDEFQSQILDAAEKLYEMSGSVLKLVNLYQPGFSDIRCKQVFYF